MSWWEEVESLSWGENRSTEAQGEWEKGSRGEIVLFSIGRQWKIASESVESAFRCGEVVGVR